MKLHSERILACAHTFIRGGLVHVHFIPENQRLSSFEEGGGEMDQQLREVFHDPNLIPSTHVRQLTIAQNFSS